VYWQVNCEVVVVVPVTVDVKVATVFAITVPLEGDTVSTMVFGLELLHPFCQIIAPASISIAAVLIVRHFMNDISLMNSTRLSTRATPQTPHALFGWPESLSPLPA
jgi:hypothetical protein